MDGGLRYRIRFTRGSLGGQMFPLGAEAVTVGRSHTCGIRVMEPDVSGRHVMLAVGADGVELEVISSRRTVLDGKQLKTGDVVGVRAGQSVAMGGQVEFMVECYRSEGEQTIGPDEPTGGMTQFGDDATARPGVVGSRVPRHPGPAAGETSMTTPAVGIEADGGDTGTHIPPPGGVRRAWRPQPPPRGLAGAARNHRSGDETSMGTVGTRAIPDLTPPEATVGTEVLHPAADATQVLQTRAATPQELAYMRELHTRKQRRRLALRLVLGILLAALAGGFYAWMVFHAPVQSLTVPPGRGETWSETALLDARLQPVPAGTESGEGLYLEAPVAPGSDGKDFTARFGLWPERDVVVQLRLSWYRDPDSLSQSREESFESWLGQHGSVNGVAVEVTGKEPDDYIGAAPGIPCLRRHYKRPATPAEEAEGVDEWEGVLSFFRLCDTCCVFSREVKSGEALRAEGVLKATGCFLGATAGMTETVWSGMKGSLQNPGSVADLQNAADVLLASGNADRWNETERYLKCILVQTHGNAARTNEYDKALAGLRKLRGQQAMAWKRLWTQRMANSSPSGQEQEAKGRQADDEVRKLFRNPEDSRSETVKKTRWWEE